MLVRGEKAIVINAACPFDIPAALQEARREKEDKCAGIKQYFYCGFQSRR